VFVASLAAAALAAPADANGVPQLLGDQAHGPRPHLGYCPSAYPPAVSKHAEFAAVPIRENPDAPIRGRGTLVAWPSRQRSVSARAFGWRHGFERACVREQSRPSCDGSEIVIAPHRRSRGRHGSHGRTWRRAASSRQRRRWRRSGKPTTPTTPSRCCLQHFRAATGDPLIRPQLSRRQPDCRELAADHI
jgi:hypothetical protein